MNVKAMRDLTAMRSAIAEHAISILRRYYEWSQSMESTIPKKTITNRKTGETMLIPDIWTESVEALGYANDAILEAVADMLGVPPDNHEFDFDVDWNSEHGNFPPGHYCRDWITHGWVDVADGRMELEKFIEELLSARLDWETGQVDDCG